MTIPLKIRKKILKAIAARKKQAEDEKNHKPNRLKKIIQKIV